MHTGQLYASYLAASDVEYAGGLETADLLFIDIEHAAQLKTVQTCGIAAYNVNGKLIDHLSVHMSVSTQSGYQRILEGFVGKEAFQVDALHTLFGREEELSQPGSVYPNVYRRQVHRVCRADGDGGHFLVNTRKHSKGGIAVKVFTDRNGGNISFGAFQAKPEKAFVIGQRRDELLLFIYGGIGDRAAVGPVSYITGNGIGT